MRKSWAYLEEFGWERVSARSVAKTRDLLYRGGPDGKTYWSTHSKGHRKRMHHVNRSSMPHFRYNESSDENTGGPGESLAHRLFKEAIAAITQTRLSLGKFGDHRIVVTHSEIEPAVKHPETTHYSDVCLWFESNTDLAFKWCGELHVEVLNTHLVGSRKHDHVRELRIAMIEIPIHEKLAYEFTEEETTDEREAAYVLRIKTWLESEKGFLAGTVLSDPCSLGFLERELEQKTSELVQSERKRLQLEANVASLTEAVIEKDRAVKESDSLLDATRQKSDDSEAQAKQSKAESARFKKQLEELIPELNDYREKDNGWLVDARWGTAIIGGTVLAAWSVVKLLNTWLG